MKFFLKNGLCGTFYCVCQSNAKASAVIRTAEAWMLFSEKGGGDQPMAWRMRAAMSSTVPRPSMTFCLPWAA